MKHQPVQKFGPHLVALLLNLLAAGFANGQCVADTTVQLCSNTTIYWERQQYDTTAPFALVHVHQNETTALQAAQWLLDSLRQGSLTTWQVQGDRYVAFSLGSGIFRFDPNRIYSRAGIAATLGKDVPDTAANLVQAVADTFLTKYIAGKQLVIALHNNTDRGGLTVKSYRPGGIYQRDALVTYINPRKDVDDFFYTTEKSFFDFLKGKGYNVVLQNNERVAADGSLSVFCASQHIPYINIEVEAGKLDRQKNMLRTLWEFAPFRVLPSVSPQ